MKRKAQHRLRGRVRGPIFRHKRAIPGLRVINGRVYRVNEHALEFVETLRDVVTSLRDGETVEDLFGIEVNCG